jgi:hypothetical protein
MGGIRCWQSVLAARTGWIWKIYSCPNDCGILQQAEPKNLLAASFFFSRGYLSNSNILFQTIAFQLGHQHSILKQVIASAIIDDPTILYTKANQLERLILDPISKMASFLPSRLVVVIDALDECDSDTAASYCNQAPCDQPFLLHCTPSLTIPGHLPTRKTSLQSLYATIDQP